MKGYYKNNSPIQYGLSVGSESEELEKNKDIYVLKKDPETGYCRHIKTISPERTISKDGLITYFESKTSHEELRRKAFLEYGKKDYILATDRVVYIQDYDSSGYEYEGFYKIWDGDWIFEYFEFNVDINLYLDYGYSKEEMEKIIKEKNSAEVKFAMKMILCAVGIVAVIIFASHLMKG
jgi:hypothetical protein